VIYGNYVPPVRHHTVPRFLLSDFGDEGPKGRRVCQLDVTTGRPRQVSPRDAAVWKHFYSIDIDGGARSGDVEEVIGLVESTAAPLIRRLAYEDLPMGERRSELALFIAMARLRTPIWRSQQKSLLEQATLMWHTESTRYADAASLRKAFVGSPWEDLSDDELEKMRQTMVDGLDAGLYELEMPVNSLIRAFLEQSITLAWVLFALDWTLVVSNRPAFVLGDTPVSVYDPTPKFPGSAAGPLSSENVEVFLPLAPTYGILAEPNPETLRAVRDTVERLSSMTAEQRADAFSGLEGRWAVADGLDEFVYELNLRTYTHAQRFIYGTQEAVCDVHRFARRNPQRRLEVTPGPPRIHILEEDSARPGAMRASHVFEPRPARRTR
jgi:hypothetical protein